MVMREFVFNMNSLPNWFASILGLVCMAASISNVLGSFLGFFLHAAIA